MTYVREFALIEYKPALWSTKKLIEDINHFFRHPFLANKSPNFWHLLHTFLFIWKISIPKTLEEQAAWSLRMRMKEGGEGACMAAQGITGK